LPGIDRTSCRGSCAASRTSSSDDARLGEVVMHRLIESLPVFGFFIGTFLLVAAAEEVGYRWASKRKAIRDTEKEPPVGAMVGATLALLAFLLTFNFGIAADAYHARRIALADEVNSIRLSYMLCDAIPEANRTHCPEIRSVLRAYVDQRLRWANGQPDPKGATANELLGRLLKASMATAAENPGSVDVFLGFVTRVIALNEERRDVRERSRIATGFWIILFAVALLAFAAVGYHGAVAGTSRSPVMLGVAVAFSAVVMVISDLDRPGEGFIDVSQQPMLDLRAALAESKP